MAVYVTERPEKMDRHAAPAKKAAQNAGGGGGGGNSGIAAQHGAACRRK